MKNPPLKPEFFRRDTVAVARDLLGQILIHRVGSQVYLGRIVETEAYLGLEDPACHSFHAKVTERTKTFYMEGGHIYIYMIYGIHLCLNFITGDTQTPEAVLIRAVEPLYGIDAMMKNRLLENSPGNMEKLCNGPGKLCEAFAINRNENSQLISPQRLGVLTGDIVPIGDIVNRPRIGLNPIQDSSAWPLRFYLAHNRFISRP